MDRTLFTPPMIETFRHCRQAYQTAFGQGEKVDALKGSNMLKRFLLRGVAEVHRGRATTVHQIQKFMGQHWPVDNFPPEDGVNAFLFAYKTLINYVEQPYAPPGSRSVGVALKVRARIPHERVYLEDTFDLILWHAATKTLELVDFHLHPLKPLDQAWPSPTVLVKHFLAERLRSRWPFETVMLTFCRLHPKGISTTSVKLEPALCKTHWPGLVSTIAEMKEAFPGKSVHCDKSCARCQSLCRQREPAAHSLPASQTA